MMPLMQKLNALLKDKRFEDADKAADEVLSMMTAR